MDIGDLVTASSTASTTSMYRLVQADQIRVFVDVPESATPEIHDGDKAIATRRILPQHLAGESRIRQLSRRGE